VRLGFGGRLTCGFLGGGLLRRATLLLRETLALRGSRAFGLSSRAARSVGLLRLGAARGLCRGRLGSVLSLVFDPR